MSDAILTIGLLLTGLLLAFTTYAAYYGLLGSITGRSFERCPDCHQHYLDDASGTTPHICDAQPQEIPLHRFHFHAGHTRHAHAGRG
jgi:hypothetical protein